MHTQYSTIIGKTGLSTLKKDFGKTLPVQSTPYFQRHHFVIPGIFDFTLCPPIAIAEAVDSEVAIGVILFEEQLCFFKPFISKYQCGCG